MKNNPNFYQLIDEFAAPLDTSGKAIFINHDQLNLSNFPKELVAAKAVLVFIESFAKGMAKPYHKKKLVFLLSSLRHAALNAARAGFKVIYWRSKDHYDEAMLNVIKRFKNLEFTAMQAAEWDSRQRQEKVEKLVNGRLTIVPNTFFIANPDEWKVKVQGGYRMEFFYREMRKRTNYLMDIHGKPEGGEWNYDKANRKALPKNYKTSARLMFEADEITKELQELVNRVFPNHFGDTKGFNYAVTKQ